MKEDLGKQLDDTGPISLSLGINIIFLLKEKYSYSEEFTPPPFNTN